MKNTNKIKFIPFYLLSLIPMCCLYLISDIAYLILYYLLNYRKEIITKNLKNSFPLKSREEICQIEKDFHRHFCDIMVESIKVLTISKKSLKKRFIVKNPELVQKFYDEKRNMILYIAHQGNWEYLAFLPLFLPYQVTTFYQPLRNKYFDELIKIIRSRFGVICVESKKGYRTILQMTKKNILTCSIMIGDQGPKKKSLKHWTSFLNQETAFLIGADRIAKKSNQVLMFSSFSKSKRGYYQLEFETIEEDSTQKESAQIIDKYAQILEKHITASPELWLWSHKRWKLTEKLKKERLKAEEGK